MIFVQNILALPLLLAGSAIDLYLAAAMARVILGGLRSDRANRLADALAPFTDGIPLALTLALSRRGRAVAGWVPWAIVIAAGLLIRHALLRAILATA